jgi:hypothetical protein
MLWPDGERTLLVDADHGDIIGHFEPQDDHPGTRRTHRAYDLLRSNSGFTRKEFLRVWSDVLDFAVGASGASKAAAKVS